MSIVSSVRIFFADLQSADDQGAANFQGPLVVAVSGGPDSVTLLHVLARRQVYPPGEIIVAHLDHSLRPNSTGDASFVQSLANDWQLHFRIRSVDVQDQANRKHVSIETAAREARYAFLTDVAREMGAKFIVTGHNRNDQAETVLMHIVRGTGLTGLRGMRSVSPVPAAGDLRLLRPLLSVSRDSIEAYCQRNKLAYVEDETNRDVSMFRNRVRHHLLPMLLEENPQVVAVLSNLAMAVEADEELIDRIANDTWLELEIEADETRIALDLNKWRELSLSLRRRLLRFGFSRLRPEDSELSFEVTELARRVAETGNTGDQVMLPDGVLLALDYGRLVLERPDHWVELRDWPLLKQETLHKLPVPGELQLDEGWTISVKRLRNVDIGQIVSNEDSWVTYIRAIYADELILRTCTVGERLRPLGMGGKSAKIADIMSNRKIHRNLRDRWPILACRDHPLWLVGHLMDERAAITAYDQDVLIVRVKHVDAVDEP